MKPISRRRSKRMTKRMTKRMAKRMTKRMTKRMAKRSNRRRINKSRSKKKMAGGGLKPGMSIHTKCLPKEVDTVVYCKKNIYDNSTEDTQNAVIDYKINPGLELSLTCNGPYGGPKIHPKYRCDKS